jgi:glycosyltransferase involved in cell wall biosynthesis
MRIILANKYYYRRGGDCIYMLNLEQLLRDHGHEVAVFSMRHPENLDTPWKEYFPSEVRFRPGKGLLKSIARPFGTGEVKKAFARLLDDFRPEVVHLNNIHSQLSPVIGEMAKQHRAKVVWTIHDFKLLCPRYDCLLQGKNPCRECYTDKRHCLSHKCMKNSWLASYIGYKEAEVWNRERLVAFTDTFVCPSRFIADEMKKGGFPKEKLIHLCNFIDVEKCLREDFKAADYYCYVGRLSEEKGIRTLIEVANSLPYNLMVIGDGPLKEELKEKSKPNIVFHGRKDWEDIKNIEGAARFTVIPSEWFENNPLSVIESECLGVPVLGARIGGIPELVERGVNGYTFHPKNEEDLKDKIELMWNERFDRPAIASKALQRFSSEQYYQALLNIYSN